MAIIKSTGASSGYKPFVLPPVPYVMTCIDAKSGETRVKHVPQVEMKFRIEDGEYSGKTFMHWQVLTDKGRAPEFIGRMLKVFDVHLNEDETWDTDELVGKTVVVHIKNENDDDGNGNHKVEYFKKVA